MTIKQPSTQLALSILLAFTQNIALSSPPTSNSTLLEITKAASNSSSPADFLTLVKRRINEWSIGVYNPDYTYNFPREDYSTKLPDYEFKQLISFGDSLSDKGTHTRSTMFLAGGYHSKLYNDYLSEYYTGKISIPNTLGGLNYAQAGSSVKNYGDNLYIRSQIDNYLNDHQGVAEPDGIYVLNAGAMDINKSFAKTIFSLKNGTYHFSDELYTIDDSPKLSVDNLVYLKSKGAKHIMMGNVPDASFTPYTPLIPLYIITTLLDKLYLPDFGLITHIGKRLDNHLRNPDNQIPASTGKELIKVNGIHTLQSILWFIPHPTVISIYDFLANLQHASTEQFNRSLELELNKVGQDVIFFDFKKLMDEVVENYKEFGFDEILVPTCDLGFSARYCDYNTRHYHQDKVYLFGDWFHPSPESHFMIYQYIQSIFDAPLYVSVISEQFSNINFAKNISLANQLVNIKQAPDKELNQWYLIAGYSGSMNNKNYNLNHLNAEKTYVNNLDIGAYTFTSPQTALGFMFSSSLGQQKPFTNFRYNHFAETVTLFSRWTNDKGLWLNAMLDFGYMKIKDIERNIKLNTYQRTEKTNSADAYSFGTNIKGGFDWVSNNSLQAGPQVTLNLSRIYVKNFRENSNRSTAMHFETHHKNDFYAELGWYIKSKNYQLSNTSSANFGAKVNYHHSLGTEKTEIRGAVNSTLTSFTRELTQPKKWLNAELNANFKIGQTGTISTNINFSTGKNQNRKIGYGIAYRSKL